VTARIEFRDGSPNEVIQGVTGIVPQGTSMEINWTFGGTSGTRVVTRAEMKRVRVY
jgi:hypothetical protein